MRGGESVEHRLEYRAGLLGFGAADGVPHWRCTCGEWRINRDQRTGSPQRETAAKKHRAHRMAVAR